MGLLSAKKRLPRSEAAMVEATDLGPITVDLGGHRLTFEDCVWLPEYEADIPAAGGDMEHELVQLRQERRKLKKVLEKFTHQSQEMKDLKERWNLLDFKYQLLLDMWTMKALDANKDGNASPNLKHDRASPPKNGHTGGHHSPQKEPQSPTRHRHGHNSPKKGCHIDS